MRSRALGPVLVSLALATAGLAGKPYVTKVDPVDGIEWRGDQFHARSVTPAAGGRFDREGVFEVENVRWGFLPPDDGTGRWRPQFAATRIDVNSAQRLTYVLNPFPPRYVAGHSALLVEFGDEGALVNQATGAKSKGLVISVEARFKPGEKYGFLRGFVGSSYPLIYMLSTWEDYQQRVLEMHGGDLERYVFTLSPDESREVARAGVAEALKDHRGEKYHLTRGSCVTRMIDLLNVGLPEGRKLNRPGCPGSSPGAA
jgi:hypothetical protein